MPTKLEQACHVAFKLPALTTMNLGQHVLNIALYRYLYIHYLLVITRPGGPLLVRVVWAVNTWQCGEGAEGLMARPRSPVASLERFDSANPPTVCTRWSQNLRNCIWPRYPIPQTHLLAHFLPIQVYLRFPPFFQHCVQLTCILCIAIEVLGSKALDKLYIVS